MLRIFTVSVVIGSAGIFGLAVPPYAAAAKCQSGYYWSSYHQVCVERPDTNSQNATALCNDGLYSHSLTPGADENCHGHGGVAQYCPCGTASGQAMSPFDVTLVEPYSARDAKAVVAG
ncbi:hypothetical protein MANY_50900 [Mycolicibacterium anyangense]|uniref:DUF3761 domain-containing protein n=1 Tax=Mycolicibacterium anyangense TaxID=1431246 RepID=A0A6N4WH74_9MYCO|nr:hypothetical protein [Mycolicibacterium anyangense]BBZ79753.1 hypothetical protein MANY_50900 [Mycolicibacterium anyangense]